MARPLSRELLPKDNLKDNQKFPNINSMNRERTTITTRTVIQLNPYKDQKYILMNYLETLSS